jgi:ketosteroid isomerase-like protein
MVSPPPSAPLEILERMRAAAIDRSAEAMTSVYAADAVHEFPFTRPGVPARAEGRDAIMSFINAFWNTSPLRYERYRTIAIHDTADPDTIVVEQEVEGTSSTTGPFVLPNVMVLTARHGQIAHVRDYASLPAVEAATGSSVSAGLPGRPPHRHGLRRVECPCRLAGTPPAAPGHPVPADWPVRGRWTSCPRRPRPAPMARRSGERSSAAAGPPGRLR